MAGLADFRQQHPEYNDMPDPALSDALYKKFYSDIPREQFDAKMGLKLAPPQAQPSILRPAPVTTRNIPQVTADTGSGLPMAPQHSWGDIGRDWGQVGIGAVEGVPAGIPGSLGDMEGAARLVASPIGVSRGTMLPTSSQTGDMMWGPAQNKYQAGGRMIGNAVSPALISRLMGIGSQAISSMIRGGGATPQAMEASAAGYRIPPNMASDQPGVVSSMLSGVGGKDRLVQSASAKNQPITNALAARELGLPADEKITLSALEGVRKKAGQAYEAVKSVPIDVLPDASFQKNLSKIGQMSQAARSEFGDLVSNPEVDKIINTLNSKQMMSPDAAVELSKSLRYKASINLKNYASPEKLELGHAQSQAANAVESLIERNMQAATTGMKPLGGQDMSGLMTGLRDARQTIAKTYDIQDALNSTTGNIDARVLGRLLDNGKPISGNLKTIAEAANAFKPAMRPPEAFGGVQGLTAMDFLAGIASHGKTAGLSLARPAVRGLLLSPPYQRALSGIFAAPAAPLGFSSPAARALLTSQLLAKLSAPEPAYTAP